MSKNVDVSRIVKKKKPILEHAQERKNRTGVLDAIIEISKGMSKKYELTQRGTLREAEKLNPGFHYLANYGFIPNTKADDGDELDILVISRDPIKQKTKLKARVIGIMYMKDRGIIDNKILAVKPNSTVKKLSDKQKRELREFFSSYKSQKTKVLGFGHRQKALKAINEAYY